METNTTLEIMIDLLNKTYSEIYDKILKLEKIRNEVQEECQDQKNETYLHCLYLHKDHVLFLDWLLNTTRGHTNMPYSITMAHEIKLATSVLCRKIELEEANERENFLD